MISKKNLTLNMKVKTGSLRYHDWTVLEYDPIRNVFIQKGK